MKTVCWNCEIVGEVNMFRRLDGKFECPDCGFSFAFQITALPKKTYDEVTEDFNKIPLTDKKAVLAAKRKRRTN
jgi:rubredoxin